MRRQEDRPGGVRTQRAGTPGGVAVEAAHTVPEARVFARRPRGGFPGRSVCLAGAALLLATLALAGGLVLGAGDAAAQTSCPAETRVLRSWELKPSAVNAGDKFRLIFITNGTSTAETTRIIHYNTFVQNEAGGGHTAIRPHKAVFRALVSTARAIVGGGIHARNNTCTGGAGGEPIYWLNGNKVADDNADFYDDDWDDESNPLHEGRDATCSWSSTRQSVPFGMERRRRKSIPIAPDAPAERPFRVRRPNGGPSP